MYVCLWMVENLFIFGFYSHGKSFFFILFVCLFFALLFFLYFSWFDRFFFHNVHEYSGIYEKIFLTKININTHTHTNAYRIDVCLFPKVFRFWFYFININTYVHKICQKKKIKKIWRNFSNTPFFWEFNG